MSNGEGITTDRAPAGGAASASDGPPVAVSVRGVSKRFHIPQEGSNTLKQRVIQPRRQRYEVLDALRDIDFDIRAGEFFGIVGRNGSGKSTLLKCMGGIYRPDAGEIATRGRVATFIELGVGFNPELSARDNVLINAVLLGLSAEQADARFEEIIAFAELKDFVDLKLKNYSSGMQVRLAFSVATHVDAEVLLIDEVLAVGDAAFQQKCFDTFRRIQSEGRTVVFVTHAMELVERFCTRALMLEQGEIVAFGDPTEVAVEYMRTNFDHMDQSAARPGVEKLGDGAAQIVHAWFENAAGDEVTRLNQGESATFKLKVRFERAMRRPVFSLSIADDQSNAVFNTNTVLDALDTGEFAAGEEVVWAVTIDNVLEDGRYLITPAVVHDGGINVAELRQDAFSILVAGRHGAGGRVNLPHGSELIR